jgi:hypothetical protein
MSLKFFFKLEEEKSLDLNVNLSVSNFENVLVNTFALWVTM